MNTRLAAALAAVLLVVLPAAPALAHEGNDHGAHHIVQSNVVDPNAKGETTVTFTFDGGFKGQEKAAEILADAGMSGTFYINSGVLGYPAYLDVEQVSKMYRMRQEIGGATVHNVDLTKVPYKKAKAEVCNDRATLDALGVIVTSFAWPYGAESKAMMKVVSDCGYNSARDVSGLYVSDSECADCPVGETVPPTSEFRIRTNTTDVSVPGLIERIIKAENNGGGWVPLVFSQVCVCPDIEGAISPTDFQAVVDWASKRPHTTRVETVDQVVGGDVEPVVGTPIPRLAPNWDPKSAATETPLSRANVYTFPGGFSISQATLIALGLVAALSVLFTYRLRSKGNRYVSPQH